MEILDANRFVIMILPECQPFRYPLLNRKSRIVLKVNIHVNLISFVNDIKLFK
jgi:hypothetical protein